MRSAVTATPCWNSLKVSAIMLSTSSLAPSICEFFYTIFFLAYYQGLMHVKARSTFVIWADQLTSLFTSSMIQTLSNNTEYGKTRLHRKNASACTLRAIMVWAHAGFCSRLHIVHLTCASCISSNAALKAQKCYQVILVASTMHGRRRAT